jgi:hypothetical protein
MSSSELIKKRQDRANFFGTMTRQQAFNLGIINSIRGVNQPVTTSGLLSASDGKTDVTPNQQALTLSKNLGLTEQILQFQTLVNENIANSTAATLFNEAALNNPTTAIQEYSQTQEDEPIGPVYPPNYGTVSILGFARQLADTYSTDVAPTSGGTLTIAETSLSSYDYTVKASDTTITSFVAGNYFTASADTRSAWIIVKGNLTINAGQTFIPSVRKLFTVVYVTGNIINNGTISMTARGANHSGTGNSGGAVTAAQIKIAIGTMTGVTDPVIPAAGGAGGTADYSGTAGAAGTGGGTGGGGGSGQNGPTYGLGSAGTSFTGGTGGGTAQSTAGNGVANGGAGGNAKGSGSSADEAAGAGNPGGNNNNDASRSGVSGTGGVLIVICEGSITGSGSIQANGVTNIPIAVPNAGGGSTGGGSVTVLHKNGCTITPSAVGGAIATSGYGRNGGAGGAGTARALAIGAN